MIDWRYRSQMIAAAALCALAACQRQQPASPPRPPKPPPPAQTGMASYYSRDLAGRPTASGTTHRPGTMTAASRTLPLGSTAKVTNEATGKSVTVKVDDRGPYAKHRILDVSRKAARKLGMKKDGVAPVAVQPLHVAEPPPPG